MPISYLIVKAPHLSLRQLMELAFDSEICTVCSSIEAMVGTASASASVLRVYWKRRVLLLPPGMETKTLRGDQCQQSVSLTTKSKPEIPRISASTSVTQTREITACRAVSNTTHRSAKTDATPTSQRRKEGNLDKSGLKK